MYINGKMLPVEIIPGMVGREMKENCCSGEFKYDVFDKLYEFL
jgi:hypothetical protein